MPILKFKLVRWVPEISNGEFVFEPEQFDLFALPDGTFEEIWTNGSENCRKYSEERYPDTRYMGELHLHRGALEHQGAIELGEIPDELRARLAARYGGWKNVSG